MATEAFAAFVEPARHRPAIWRLVIGLILALIVYVVVSAGVFVGYWAWIGQPNDLRWAQSAVAGSDPRAMFLLLSTFAGMGLGAMAAAWALHRRSGFSVFGPRSKLLRHFLFAAATGGVVIGGSVLGWALFFDAEPNLDFSRWLWILPFSLLGVLVQTGAEEMLFRGYLQQQLAARFRSPLLWLILPALLFGLVHYNPEGAGENTWLLVGAAAFFGLIAADLTAQTGSIGAAWGLHFVNNCVALIFVATEGSLTGLSLYLTPYSVDDASQMAPLLIFDLFMLTLCWVFIRRRLRA